MCGILSPKCDAVPAHVWDLEPLPPFPEIRGEPFDDSRDDAEAGSVVLLTALEDHLGSEADSKDRFAVLHPFFQMAVQTALPEVRHCRAGGADAGEDDMACVIQQSAISCDHAGFVQRFQRPGDAGEVSRPVIHDADHAFPLFCPVRKT